MPKTRTATRWERYLALATSDTANSRPFRDAVSYAGFVTATDAPTREEWATAFLDAYDPR